MFYNQRWYSETEIRSKYELSKFRLSYLLAIGKLVVKFDGNGIKYFSWERREI